jgi:hypothetical protein
MQFLAVATRPLLAILREQRIQLLLLPAAAKLAVMSLP